MDRHARHRPVASHTLDNGLKVICVRKSSAPVVAVQLWYRTGSVNESEGSRGISHMIEHMMFRGSANVPSEAHAQRINEVGGHSNAFTAEDVTAFVNSVPREYLDMVLELEADRMACLTLDPALLETERGVVVEEYHTYMNNPVAKAFLEYRQVFYGNHPYATSPLGALDDIRSVGAQQCRDYYRDWYGPQNAVLVVAGDFPGAGPLFESVHKYFGNVPRSRRSWVTPVEERIPAGEGGREPSSRLERRVEFDVPILITGYPAPPSSHEDAVRLDMLQVIASQGETGRLYRSLVTRRGLAVMAGGMNHLLRLPGMSLFFAAFTPDVSAAKVERALNAEIEQIKRDGISEEEVQKVRNAALAHRAFELYSAENICQRLGHAETMEGDYRLWVERLELLETLGREQLMATARRYWNAERRHTLYLRPKKTNPLLYVTGLVRRLLPGR
jgi:zinc protease